MSEIEKEDATRTFNEIADEIARRHCRLVDMASRCDDRMTAMKGTDNEASRRKMSDWWTLVACQGAYVKLRLIVEEHFREDAKRNAIFGDSIGLIAVARYMFELIVWLKTLQKDPRNGLFFRFCAVSRDLQHRRGTRDQIKREIALFQRLAEEENRRRMEITNDKTLSPEALVRAAEKVSDDMDRRARSQFSIYVRQIEPIGFAEGAKHLEDKTLPVVLKQIPELEREKSELKRILRQNGLDDPKWIWAQRAEAVGMKERYEFFYGYASRLLHAEPVSFATHEPALHDYEIIALLDHILATIDEAAELGKNLLKRFPKPASS
jgi:hypothetical protein